MKLNTLIYKLSTLLLGFQIVSADSIVLNDDTKFDGKIIRETEEEYVIEIAVTKSIKDERIIKKSDVKSMVRDTPDAKAYSKITTIAEVPEFEDMEEYASRIAQVENFIKSYPKSKFLPKAEKSLAILKSESAVIADGGVKFGGLLISSEHYEQNAYEFDAKISQRKIEKTIEQNNLIYALRLYAKYNAYFSSMSGQRDFAMKMRPVLQNVARSLEVSLSNYDEEKARKQADLEKMSGDLRRQTELALKDEQARIKNRYERELADEMKWVTPDSRYKPTMVSFLKAVKSELQAIDKSSQDEAEKPVTSLAKLYRDTWSDLNLATPEEREEKLKAAKDSGLPEVYLMKLRKHSQRNDPQSKE